MVLAVMRPHWRITLLDSLRKRCDFLARAAEVAGGAGVMCRVGQSRMHTPYITVYKVISLPKIPCVHCMYIVLVDPSDVWCVRSYGRARDTHKGGGGCVRHVLLHGSICRT
jgi:hypothetical protein